MKFRIAAVVLFTLGLSFTTAQECAEISVAELQRVFLNEVGSNLPEGSPVPTAVELREYKFNCLAPGCMRGTYRSLAVTANYSYSGLRSQIHSNAIYVNSTLDALSARMASQGGHPCRPVGPELFTALGKLISFSKKETRRKVAHRAMLFGRNLTFITA